MPSSRRVPCYFEINFLIVSLKGLFKKITNKNLENFQIFPTFVYIKFVIFHKPDHLRPKFFLLEILYRIRHILAWIKHLHRFYFLKTKNSNACSTAPAMF